MSLSALPDLIVWRGHGARWVGKKEVDAGRWTLYRLYCLVQANTADAGAFGLPVHVPAVFGSPPGTKL